MGRYLVARIAFTVVVFCLAFASWVFAGHSYEGTGERFSDPGEVMAVEEGWQEGPIKYKNVPGDTELSIIVNQQVAPALTPFVKKFTEERKIRLDYSIGTCGISSGALSRKEVDMGGFCCPPGRMDRLPGLKYRTLGISPLLLLVHKDNPVRNISLEQARALFAGRITRWSELGGPDIEVIPLGMLHCKKRPGHWRLILDNADLFSPRFKVTGDIEDTITMVSSTPGAVGFELIVNVRHFGKLGDVRALWIDGMDPLDLSYVRRSSYPFYRVMNIATWEGPEVENPLAGELAEYMTQKVEELDPTQGIVPASELRKAGWKFFGDELVGEPER